MRLTDLIKQKTASAEVPKNEDVEKQNKENNDTSIPKKKEEIPIDVLKQYEVVGEVHASMFAFCVESPLHAFNGIYNKLRKKKINKKYKDNDEQREKEINKIVKTYEANKKVIDLEDSEFRHLKNAFTALAKQNKSTETSPTMMVASAVIGILIRRAEIIIDEE